MTPSKNCVASCGGGVLPELVDGSCGSAQHRSNIDTAPVAQAACIKGQLSNMQSAVGHFTWQCKGQDGGTTAQCIACKSKYIWKNGQCTPVPVATPACGENLGTCKVGNASPLETPNALTKKWKCTNETLMAQCHIQCPANATWNQQSAQCECSAGYHIQGKICVPDLCTLDIDGLEIE